MAVSSLQYLLFYCIATYSRTTLASGVRPLLLFSKIRSRAWDAESEEQEYEVVTAAISRYASPIDQTFARQPTAVWSDFGFAAEFPDFAAEHTRLPLFRVNTNVAIESGSMPYRTGVYVSADDPNAVLQFAWAGPHPCPLRMASTFKEVGMEALSFVGRNKLWFDQEAMLKFASTVSYRDMFEDFLTVDGRLVAERAPPAVAGIAASHMSAGLIGPEFDAAQL